MPKLVLAVGDPFNGMSLYGPFDHMAELDQYAELNCKNEDWFWVELKEITGYGTGLHPEAWKIMHENPWAEHATISRQDWRDEVAENNTNLGYWEWLSHQLEELDKENENERIGQTGQ